MTDILIKKNDFEFSLPAGFEVIYEDDRRVQANGHLDEAGKQPTTLDIQIAPVSDIDNCDGATFTDKVDDYCQQYESETLSIDSEFYKGFETYFLKLKVDTRLAGDELRVNGMFAVLLLDADFCLVFSYLFDMSQTERFEPLAKTILDSIDVVGEAATRAKSFKAFADKMNKLVEQRSQRFEPENRLPELIEALTPANQLTDLQATFDVEGVEFDADYQKVSISIAKSSRKFYAKFEAKAKDLEAAKESGLIDDYYKGDVCFEVSLDNVYHTPHVTGQFSFDDGSTGFAQWFRFDCRGVDSSFKFFGQVELLAGWIICRGVLAKKYDEFPTYRVNISFPFDTNSLNWEDYEFSLHEALEAPTEQVRYLTLNHFEQTELPKRIFEFTGLQKLSILGFEGADCALSSIPKDIGVLTKLESLAISNTAITTLPKELGHLKKLEDASFMNNQLLSVPSELFNLPKLKRLNLTNNQLAALPAPVNLSSLIKLDVAGNRLTSLPTEIALLPALQELALYDNPFETLPNEVANIPRLELEIDQKQRLLDFTYPGADGQGMIEWANDAYFAHSDGALSKQLDRAINGSFLANYREALRHVALKSVCIKTNEADDYSAIGNIRFGGLPDLPPELPYPTITPGNSGPNTGSQFIAQLNCADLTEFQAYLPRHGMLYFFLDDQESLNCKVFYHADASHLISASELDIDDEFIYDDHGVVNASRASCSAMIALPHFYNDSVWFQGEAEILKNIEDDDEYDELLELRDQLSKQLGVIGETGFNDHYYPDNHHAINTYMFSQGDPAQVNAANALKGNPEDWMVLLKVYSDDFCFWDSGEIAFVIHKSDLAKCDFSNVVCCLESS